MKTIDRARLQSLMQREQKKFVDERPKSKALFERARKSLLAGVPMNWMVKWAGAFPPFVREAQGAHFFDVDGHRYIDFCLGDTGAMTGHSPFATVKAVEEQIAARHHADAAGGRCDLRGRGIAEAIQPAVLAVCAHGDRCESVFDPAGAADHGATEDSGLQLVLSRHGGRDVHHSRGQRGGGAAAGEHWAAGESGGHDQGGRVQRCRRAGAALAPGDVACVLAEPAMTNVGIVHPQPGYHQALRELTRKHGTLLIIDETHTICAGPGGFTRAENLDPDVLVFGKAIGGGIPGAAYGFSQEVADRIAAKQELENCDVGGIGGTLAGNALSLAAMRATLTKVLTKEAFDRMIPMAERWTAGVAKAIADAGLPWHVTRLGCRAEYLFGAETPKNGARRTTRWISSWNASCISMP